MIKGNLSSIAIFILRVTLGVIFLAHGLQKLFGVFGGSGIEGFSQMLAGLNLTPANFLAWLVAIIEALGGLFLIFGILPRLSSALIAVIMAVAIAKIHAANGFFAMKGGFEYQLLILAVCLLFVFTGGGKFSLLNKW
ncbi:MAG: DoxX family protein [Candidatus Omnitrophota bacterium]|jgi:putative oxidoreductase